MTEAVTARELRRLYHSEQLSYAGIAERLRCSRTWVGKLMRRHRIEPRSKSVARKVAIDCGRVAYPAYSEAELLEREGLRRERAVAAQRRYRRRHPKRTRARWVLAKAVKDGRVERPGVCDRCGVGCRPYGHHEDYERPLEVEWLCWECHGKEHRRAGERARDEKRVVS